MLRQWVEAGGGLSIRTSADGFAVVHLAVLADPRARLCEVVELAATLDIQTAIVMCAGVYNNRIVQNALEKAEILLDGGGWF